MHFIERISGIFSHYTPHTMLGLAMTVVVIIAMVNLFKSRNDFTDFSSTIPMHDYGLGDAPIAKRMNSFAVPVSVAIINISNSGRSEKSRRGFWFVMVNNWGQICQFQTNLASVFSGFSAVVFWRA